MPEDSKNTSHTNSVAPESVSDEVYSGFTKFSRRSVFLVSTLVIFGAIWWLFIGFPTDDALSPDTLFDEYRDLHSLSLEYSAPEEAVLRAQKLLTKVKQAGAPAFVVAYVQTEIARHLFRTNDVEKQREAVRIAKMIASDTQLSRQQRASAVTRILTMYYSCRSDYIRDEIFSRGPFENFQAHREIDAVRGVAQTSVNLYPTPLGVLHEANWYSAELLDNTKLTQEQRQNYIEEIQTALVKASALFTQQFSEITQENISDTTLYYHWRGYHLGVLELTGEGGQLRDSFEESFQRAMSLYQPGDPTSRVVSTTVAFTHYYYAALLGEVFGEERKADQQQLLSDLILMVQTDPDLYATGFVNLVNVERDRLPETRDHNYKWFVDLAKVSPEFKTFLETHGWEL